MYEYQFGFGAVHATCALHSQRRVVEVEAVSRGVSFRMASWVSLKVARTQRVLCTTVPLRSLNLMQSTEGPRSTAYGSDYRPQTTDRTEAREGTPRYDTALAIHDSFQRFGSAPPRIGVGTATSFCDLCGRDI